MTLTPNSTHQLIVDFIDFQLFHLKFAVKLYITPDESLSIGDKLVMCETDPISNQVTGRTITCEVGLIDKQPKCAEALDYWELSVIWVPF